MLQNTLRSGNIPLDEADAKKSRIAKSEGYISVAVNTCLGSFKLWVGTITGSLAVFADGWETLSDCISSIVLLIGLKVSEVPADKEHPFGHGRAELVASIIISTILATFGFSFAKSGIMKIVNHETLVFGFWTFSAGIASVVVKESLAQYALWAERKTGMISLRADAQSHRSDAISSALILVGMIVARLGGDMFWWMDGALSVLISALLLRLAWSILSATSKKILGSAVSPELEEKIVEICVRISGTDLCAHHMHIHEYGEHKELTFHTRFDGNMSMKDAHEIVDKVEKTIRAELKMDATIHLEIKKDGVPQRCIPAK